MINRRTQSTLLPPPVAVLLRLSSPVISITQSPSIPASPLPSLSSTIVSQRLTWPSPPPGIAKTRSMIGNHNHDDSTSRKVIKSCDPWSDLNHDVLFLVMMQLGVFDFLAFSRVCKSWRSFALSKRDSYMVSRPPMSISLSADANEKQCYLKDFERRKFKTILPHSAGRTCVGLTFGYLILFGEKTRDFWLVNPITSHELHFPNAFVFHSYERFRAILVFSPSISGWVLVMLNFFTNEIWFSIAGKRKWTYVSTPFFVHDLYAFKGKIYTLHYVDRSYEVWRLYEMRLYPKPKLQLIETKNFLKLHSGFSSHKFASYGEHLYVIEEISIDQCKIHEIDLDELKWVSREKTQEEYAFFHNGKLKHGGVVIPDFRSQYGRYAVTDKGGKHKFFYARMWYFFHDCLNVNLLHES